MGGVVVDLLDVSFVFTGLMLRGYLRLMYLVASVKS